MNVVACFIMRKFKGIQLKAINMIIQLYVLVFG
jgi:hypothetical protein